MSSGDATCTSFRGQAFCITLRLGCLPLTETPEQHVVVTTIATIDIGWNSVAFFLI